MHRLLGRVGRPGECGIEPTSRVLTIPNVISLARLLLVPVFVWLLARPGDEAWGLVLLGVVAASDWVDGYVARRTGQISAIGSVLDPLADRVLIVAALITFVAQGVFPLWAAVLVIGRDLCVLGGVFVGLVLHAKRVPVRWTGKVATFNLMVGIPLVAWGGFGLPLEAATEAVGWTLFCVGTVLYFVIAGRYAGDLMAVLRASQRG